MQYVWKSSTKIYICTKKRHWAMQQQYIDIYNFFYVEKARPSLFWRPLCTTNCVIITTVQVCFVQPRGKYWCFCLLTVSHDLDCRLGVVRCWSHFDRAFYYLTTIVRVLSAEESSFFPITIVNYLLLNVFFQACPTACGRHRCFNVSGTE